MTYPARLHANSDSSTGTSSAAEICAPAARCRQRSRLRLFRRGCGGRQPRSRCRRRQDHWMVPLVRSQAADAGFDTVDFILTEIESRPSPMPVSTSSSPTASSTSASTRRVSSRKPEGCLNQTVASPSPTLSTSQRCPAASRKTWFSSTGCISGATPLELLRPSLHAAGFVGIDITSERPLAC